MATLPWNEHFSHLKINGWKIQFPYWGKRPIFRGELSSPSAVQVIGRFGFFLTFALILRLYRAHRRSKKHWEWSWMTNGRVDVYSMAERSHLKLKVIFLIVSCLFWGLWIFLNMGFILAFKTAIRSKWEIFHTLCLLKNHYPVIWIRFGSRQCKPAQRSWEKDRKGPKVRIFVFNIFRKSRKSRKILWNQDLWLVCWTGTLATVHRTQLDTSSCVLNGDDLTSPLTWSAWAETNCFQGVEVIQRRDGRNSTIQIDVYYYICKTCKVIEWF